MTPKVVASKSELVAAIRARRDELELNHLTIDDISGLPSGYTSKLLAPNPGKNFGTVSLRDMLGALALRVAVVVLVEDPEQAARMAHRWTKRKRGSWPHKSKALAPPAPPAGALLGDAHPGNSHARRQLEMFPDDDQV